MAVLAPPTSPVYAPFATRRSAALSSFGLRKKSEIDIALDGKDEFIHSYSTFDEIKGHAHLRFDKDTPIDSLNITFQGQSSAWVEKMTAMSPRTGRATAKHVFLRLQQPIEGSPFSEDNIAKAGVTYSIPFQFVVPEKVLPFVCKHSVKDESIRDQHCHLPPSIGEEMLAGEGSVLMDDLCPSMAKVVYSIHVNAVKSSATGRNREEIHNSIGIRIIPSRPEVITDVTSPYREGCLRYHLRKEKDVRKGILKLGRKQGRLTAETTQPRSLRLPHQQEQNKEAVTTTATINFRYDPASLEEAPPPLTSVETRLKAYTFFGAAPFMHLPDPSNYDIWSLMHGQYSLTVDLSTLNLSSVRWTKHDPESPFAERMRHESVATSTSSKTDYQRKLSTSTGSGSIGVVPQSPTLNRTNSDLSRFSSNTFSPASSTTTLSSPASPSITGSNMSFTGPATVSPSARYDQTLPYYTASIIVPVTLPSSHCSNSSISKPEQSSSRRSSAAVGPDNTDTSSRRGSVDPSGTSFSSSGTLSRRRGVPTLLPSFHSCLISRAYALELIVHASNPAPQISLRTPIQIVASPSPTSPPRFTSAVSPSAAPLSWYDPFELVNMQGGDAQDTASDEAIARALEHQYSSHPSDPIPSYADLQIHTTDNVASCSSGAAASGVTSLLPQRRHDSAPVMSTPLTSDFTRVALAADKPPEYDAPVGFRRRQSTPLQAQSPSATSSTTTAASAQNQNRRGSLGWTKKLGLRT